MIIKSEGLMISRDDPTCAARNPLWIRLGPIKGLCGDEEVIQTARDQVRDIRGIFQNLDARDVLRAFPGHIVTVAFLVPIRMIPHHCGLILSNWRHAQIFHVERFWLWGKTDGCKFRSTIYLNFFFFSNIGTKLLLVLTIKICTSSLSKPKAPTVRTDML